MITGRLLFWEPEFQRIPRPVSPETQSLIDALKDKLHPGWRDWRVRQVTQGLSINYSSLELRIAAKYGRPHQERENHEQG